MKIKPLGDKVLVERFEAETETPGGIYIPKGAQEKPSKGKVISVGEGKLLEDGTVRKPSVKKGDTILFTSYGGTDVMIDGKKYLIMSETDIMAVIDE